MDFKLRSRLFATIEDLHCKRDQQEIGLLRLPDSILDISLLLESLINPACRIIRDRRTTHMTVWETIVESLSV